MWARRRGHLATILKSTAGSRRLPRLERSEVLSLGLYARRREANVLQSFLREQAAGLPDDIMITGITLLVLGRDLD